ncbi:MAG: hypothetical protein PHQ19_05435 [Candidatus Krumholzibacteria bacterium]|nr:hypothetical protein [Candidatus Krumholzibacteria bacterium]
MNGKIDIERLLMRIRTGIDPRVKRAVLSRYDQRFGSAQGSAGTVRLWRRPVPFYLAAAAVLAVAVLSFAGGRRFPHAERVATTPAAVSRDSLASAEPEQEWRFTQRDAL